MNTPLKVLLLLDDSPYTIFLTEVLRGISNIDLQGVVQDSETAFKELSKEKIDILLFDIEMSSLNGLETLKKFQQAFPHLGIVIISGNNKNSADITIKALEAGALEFIPRPSNENIDANIQEIIQRLTPIVRTLSIHKSSITPTIHTRPTQSHIPEEKSAESKILTLKEHRKTDEPKRFDIIAIGVSTGGPNALNEIIPNLPTNLGIPILVVQHMPSVFTSSLANNLNIKSKLHVKEGEPGEPVLPNTVYIAPGGQHMTVIDHAKTTQGYHAKDIRIQLNSEPPEHSCRPSVDVLFRSIAQTYEKNVLAVILTGMGKDGAQGVKLLKQKGCYCITQSENTCVVYGMPRSVVEMGLSDENVDLNNLPYRITTLLRRNQRG